MTWLAPSPPRSYPARTRWFCRTRGDARAIVERVGVVAATSANRHGGPDPRTVDEVPREIRDRCGSIVDAGPLPGTPSTVLDLTGPGPRVIREGAVAAADALAQAREAAR